MLDLEARFFIEYGYRPAHVSTGIQLVDEGLCHDMTLLLNVLREEIRNHNLQSIDLPLSGGFDSRLLLAILVEMGLKNNIQLRTWGTPGIYDFDIPIQISRSLDVPILLHDQSLFDYSLENLVEERNYNQSTLFFHTYYGSMNHNSCIVTGVAGDILFGSSQDYRVKTADDAKSHYLKGKRINNLYQDNDYYDLISYESFGGSFLPNEEILLQHRSKLFYEPLIVKDSQDYFLPFLSEGVLTYFGARTRDYKSLSKLKLELESYICSVIGLFPSKNYYGLTSKSSHISLKVAKYWSRLHGHSKMANNFIPTGKVLDNLDFNFLTRYKQCCDYLNLDFSQLDVMKTVLPYLIDSDAKIS